MDSDRLLGDFLRARRHVTTPERVGLPPIGRRRTPGLRREEVAMLAGVSAEYYGRLEQGRERRPSEQVIDALARALRLDSEATQHLRELARPRTVGPRPVDTADQLSPTILRLLDSWNHIPAFVVNRRLDILAMNQVTTALFEWLPHHDNLVRLTFLNPEAREFYPRWEQEAMSDVAHLHAEAGALGGDPFLVELVEELSTESEDFGRLWARHDIRARNQEFVHLRHPQAGEMTLRHETVRFDSAPDLCVFLGEPEPGSPSEAALSRLRGHMP
ncbi:helix-turn-helix domain-containing protein [Microbispora sp. RL4-1S]|uniref:Helix-turn-helix domain-containing protein n=1 Tax=Microbispora oryzae TaxID=2806554 RepID=A0A941AJT7_9ACTN|nr:helix-turn-helix transcriptional regulator [Microbispora oryzae]MBP2706720.1 helix-turn-helix domain-containing protein [Microbispora oryzae]